MDMIPCGLWSHVERAAARVRREEPDAWLTVYIAVLSVPQGWTRPQYWLGVDAQPRPFVISEPLDDRRCLHGVRLLTLPPGVPLDHAGPWARVLAGATPWWLGIAFAGIGALVAMALE